MRQGSILFTIQPRRALHTSGASGRRPVRGLASFQCLRLGDTERVSSAPCLRLDLTGSNKAGESVPDLAAKAQHL